MNKDMGRLLAVTCAALYAMASSAGTPHTNENATAIAADSSRVYDIDEIVVTNRPKDAFNLRRQPVSATSLSSHDLKNVGAKDLRDLSAFIPSFSMPNYGTRYTSSLYMRGFGSRVNNPAVGIYVDDIPVMCKSAYNSYFHDIARVDVLRGPQGTLYGQNTEGGLVKMYTKNPMYYEGTDIKVSCGTYFWRNAEFGHFHKIDDTMAFSVSAFYDGTNGFLRNSSTGERADRLNEAGGRLRLMLAPTVRLAFDVTADYQHVEQNGFAYGALDPETGRTEAPSSNHSGRYLRDIANAGVTTKYETARFYMQSTTSYQYLHDNMLMDQDYTNIDYMHLKQKQLHNTVTEELTLKSKTATRWRWLFGLAGNYQWLRTTAPVYFGEATTNQLSTVIQKAMYNGIVQGMINKGMSQQMAESIIQKAGGVSVETSLQVPETFRTPQFCFGIFHESNINITPRLVATIGLRYEYNHNKVDYDSKAEMKMKATVMGIEATNTLTSKLVNGVCSNASQLLPKIGLSYVLDKNNSLVYAVLSKGYRAGGYNIQMFSDILQSELMTNYASASKGDYDVPHTDSDYDRVNNTISYKPETSWNYELGGHFNLLGNALQMDFSLYYMRISNQQLSIMAGTYGFGRMMVNAGKSRSCGLELGLRGSAFGNRLAWALNYGYTNAEFVEYEDSVKVGGKYVTNNYKGKKVPYVPCHTIGAAADYRLVLPAGVIQAVTFGVNATAQGRIYWDEANTYSQKFYALVNAHVDAEIKNLTVSAWGRNLTDTRYNTFAMSSSATRQLKYFAQRGMPLQVGVDIKLHF